LTGNGNAIRLSGYGNTALGQGSLSQLSTGHTNIGIGTSAGNNITTGIHNTIVGKYTGTATLSNTVAIYTGDGQIGLKVDSNGLEVNGAAVGGASDIDGLSDGFWSGTYSTLGLGSGALSNHSNGYWNVAIGWNSMNSLTSGNYSVAVGYNTLSAMTTARDCTAIGYTALKLATAQRNTGVGFAAGKNITTGENNSCIGNEAQAPSATYGDSFTLGNSNVIHLRCNDTSISSLSDQRDKTNIQDIPDSAGIDFINKLRPVTYHWDRREWYEDGNPDGSQIKADWRRWKPNSGLKQGFIAQEVQTAINGEKCLEDSMIVTDDNPDKLEFAPQHLLTNAIKAIQQLSAENQALLARIETLENA